MHRKCAELFLSPAILSSNYQSVFLPPSCFQVDDPEAAFKELETYLGFPLQGFVPYTRSVRPSMEIPRDHLQKYLETVLGDHATGIAVLFALQPERLHVLEPLALSIIRQMD